MPTKEIIEIKSFEEANEEIIKTFKKMISETKSYLEEKENGKIYEIVKIKKDGKIFFGLLVSDFENVEIYDINTFVTEKFFPKKDIEEEKEKLNNKYLDNINSLNSVLTFINLDDDEFKNTLNIFLNAKKYAFLKYKEMYDGIIRYFDNLIFIEPNLKFFKDYLACFTIATYIKEGFDRIGYLLVTGEQGSGKTTLIEALRDICWHALPTGSVSVAALARLCESQSSTLVLDEFGLLPEETEKGELLSILRSGIQRGIYYVRYEGGNPKKFNVFGFKALAVGVTKYVPNDIVDRAIKVNLFRARFKPNKKEAKLIRDRLIGLLSAFRIWALQKNNISKIRETLDFFEEIIGLGYDSRLGNNLKILAFMPNFNYSEILEREITKKIEVIEDTDSVTLIEALDKYIYLKNLGGGEEVGLKKFLQKMKNEGLEIVARDLTLIWRCIREGEEDILEEVINESQLNNNENPFNLLKEKFKTSPYKKTIGETKYMLNLLKDKLGIKIINAGTAHGKIPKKLLKIDESVENFISRLYKYIEEEKEAKNIAKNIEESIRVGLKKYYFFPVDESLIGGFGERGGFLEMTRGGENEGFSLKKRDLENEKKEPVHIYGLNPPEELINKVKNERIEKIKDEILNVFAIVGCAYDFIVNDLKQNGYEEEEISKAISELEKENKIKRVKAKDESGKEYEKIEMVKNENERDKKV